MNKWYRKIRVFIPPLTLLFLFLFSGNSLLANADLRPTAEQTPSQTLIIGTHLISFQALSQEVLEIAEKSVDETKKGEPEDVQDRVFYKSELNDGVWYDITHSESILDITVSSRRAVTNSVIDDLVLTHWTRSDGTTIDLTTGEQVSLHELDSPEDPLNMPELEVLAMEQEVQQGKYEALQELAEDKEGEERREIEEQLDGIREMLESMDRVFAEVEDEEEIDELNQMLEQYEDMSQQLVDEIGASDSIVNLAREEKDRVRAQRDLAIYEKVQERLSDELEVVGLLEETDIIDLYGTALDEINQTITELQTETDEVEEENTLDLMSSQMADVFQDQVVAANPQAGYEQLKKMQAVNDIFEETIRDRELELELIEEAKSSLLEEIRDNFTGGEPQDYQEAKAAGESQAVLDGLLQDILNESGQQMEELDDLMEYYLFRVDFSPLLQLQAADDLADELNDLLDSVPDDDLKEGAEDLLNDLLDDQNSLRAGLKAEQDEEMAARKDAVDDLRNQADELEEGYYLATEEGDQEEMDRLKEELDEVNDRLNEEQDKAAEEYKDLLDAHDQLQDRLAEAETAEERKAIREAIDDVLTEKAGLEPLLEEKNRNNLQYLDELKDELKDALDSDDQREISAATDELMDLLDLIPDNLFSDQQKKSQAEEIIEQLEKKAEQLEARGNTGAAQNMSALAEEMEERIVEPPVPPEPPKPPVRPEYYLNFVDQGIRITQPYREIDDIIYIPARVVFEALGARLTWQPGQQGVVVQDPARSLLLEYRVGSDTAYRNDRRISLEGPAKNIRGVTFVPLQLLLDAYRLEAEERNGVFYLN